MTPSEIRKRHYANLNGYRELPGYVESRSTYEGQQAFFATIVGQKWEIDEAVYDEFLEMLPPIGWRADTFYMSEFTFDDITTKFCKEGGRYYCEFARFSGKR